MNISNVYFLKSEGEVLIMHIWRLHVTNRDFLCVWYRITLVCVCFHASLNYSASCGNPHFHPLFLYVSAFPLSAEGAE